MGWPGLSPAKQPDRCTLSFRRSCVVQRGYAAALVLLLIDNYDSFTYNLVHRIGELDPDIRMEVVRNDKITVEQAAALAPSHLIISPGPCTPRESGISPDLIMHFKGIIPILGVLLVAANFVLGLIMMWKACDGVNALPTTLPAAA